jgi:hypothetical protein
MVVLMTSSYSLVSSNSSSAICPVYDGDYVSHDCAWSKGIPFAHARPDDDRQWWDPVLVLLDW